MAFIHGTAALVSLLALLHTLHAMCSVSIHSAFISRLIAPGTLSHIPRGCLLLSHAAQGWRQRQACLVAWQAVSAAQVHHRTWRLGCCLLTWHAWAARRSALRQSLETLLALKKVSRISV